MFFSENVISEYDGLPDGKSRLKQPGQCPEHSSAGKTTLMVGLGRGLTSSHIRMGTIKHSFHSHELDKPGKDFFRRRNARAEPAAMMTYTMTARYLPTFPDLTPDDLIQRYFSDCNIMLIEGLISELHKKVLRQNR